jgi:hypothetical protein
MIRYRRGNAKCPSRIFPGAILVTKWFVRTCADIHRIVSSPNQNSVSIFIGIALVFIKGKLPANEKEKGDE